MEQNYERTKGWKTGDDRSVKLPKRVEKQNVRLLAGRWNAKSHICVKDNTNLGKDVKKIKKKKNDKSVYDQPKKTVDDHYCVLLC